MDIVPSTHSPLRDKIGLGAMAFYRELRLDNARNLPRHASPPLTEIALATSFANSGHFSRWRSNPFGAPPSSLRQ